MLAYDRDAALARDAAIAVLFTQRRDLLERHAERLRQSDQPRLAQLLGAEDLIGIAAAFAIGLGHQEAAPDVIAHRIGAEPGRTCEFGDQHDFHPLTMD